jgi:glycosyltransferase involved in cell wall biosynthesis
MNKPYFSVVIPLYNKEKFILRALKSILNQSFKDFEVIIVNDGSTDNSLIKAQEINDERIRIVSQVNSGPGAARNRGIKESNGIWIAFLDADDEYHSSFLQKVFDTSIEIPKAEVIYSLSYLKENNIIISPKIGLLKPEIINYFEYTNIYWKSRRTEDNLLLMNSSSTCVCKSAFNKSGLFLENTFIGEDIDTWHRLAWTSNIVIIPEILTMYNLDDGSSGYREKESDFNLRLKSFRDWNNKKLIPRNLLSDTYRYINYCILWESYRFVVKGCKFKSLKLLLKNICLPNVDLIFLTRILLRTITPNSLIPYAQKIKKRIRI